MNSNAGNDNVKPISKFDEPVKTTEKAKAPKGGAWVHVAWVTALAIALAGNYYFYNRSERLSTDLAKVQDTAASQSSRLGEVAALLEANRARIDALGEELNGTHQTTSVALQRARSEAKRASADLAKTFDQRIAEQQQAHQAVTSELSAIKETTDSKFTAVDTSVSGVKAEVATTREELHKTDGDLRRAVGDMGVMSGLIATNAKDLAALRQLGERNYYEFTLGKNGEAKVGDLRLTLKKADPKRNRFTFTVFADDKLVEKKDRTINEPVQLYRAGQRLPYEIVINEVKKDQVIGYLATPKVSIARR